MAARQVSLGPADPSRLRRLTLARCLLSTEGPGSEQVADLFEAVTRLIEGRMSAGEQQLALRLLVTGGPCPQRQCRTRRRAGIIQLDSTPEPVRNPPNLRGLAGAEGT